ncbi:MAG: efflux RND transporter periplasmic adaptor subunit [Syntrophomonas sp.]
MAEIEKEFDFQLDKDLSTVSKSRKRIFLIGAIVLISLAAWGLYKWLSPDNKTSYITVPAAKATITDAIQATATLEPVEKVEMNFKNVENVSALNLEAGDRVKKGQVIAEQDTTELNAQLRQAESDVLQQELQLENLSIVDEQNLRTLEQQKQLFASGIIAQTDLDKAQDTYKKGQLDITSAKARLQNLQAKLDIARNDLENTKLIAPFSGIVSQVNGNVGQNYGGNDNNSTAFLTIVSEELQLRALINEVDIGRIKTGQDVEFTSNAYADKTFRGKVLKVYPEATTVSNVQFYPALISCEDPGRLLKSGMTVTANIIAARKENVLTASMMATSFAETYLKNNRPANINNISKRNESPENSGSPSQARPGSGDFVRNENQRVILTLQNEKPVVKHVQVGLNDGQNIEIVSGLNPGDKVIIGSTQTSQSNASGTNFNRTNSSNSTSSNRQNSSSAGGNVMRVPGMGRM